MEKFESHKFQHKLNSEFRKIEEFLHEFETDFSKAIHDIIYYEYPDVISSDKIDEAILIYANEVISVAESVCDKDLSYTEIRLKEELDNMARVVEKYPPENRDHRFLNLTHQKAKELIVNYYPHIFDLSSTGFRLLEKYCQMYNWKFVDIFYSLKMQTL